MKYTFKIDANAYTTEVIEVAGGQFQVTVNGKVFNVGTEALTTAHSAPTAPMRVNSTPTVDAMPAIPTNNKPAAVAGTGGSIVAPIPGLITKVMVKEGDKVTAGQQVAIMEAMKMENHLTTHLSGVVQELNVQSGSEVTTGQVIMRIG